jgi:hypothetical protein
MHMCLAMDGLPDEGIEFCTSMCLRDIYGIGCILQHKSLNAMDVIWTEYDVRTTGECQTNKRCALKTTIAEAVSV